MGNKYDKGKTNQKIKDVGEYFFLDNFHIYNENALNNVQSIINYNQNIIVQETKKDPFLDYKIIKTIGDGTFGKVELVEHKITGMIRAMKIIPKANEINEMSVLNEFNNGILSRR